MKNKLLFIISIIILLTVSSTTISAINNKNENPPTSEYFKEDIIDLINKIDENLVYNYLQKLVSYGPRRTGTLNCSRAAVFLYQEFKNLGLKPEIHRWEFQGFKSSNIIGTIEGNDPSNDAIIIMSAHYDTTKGSPGANDDGSGVAAILAIANILSKCSFDHTIRFIAFSGEEVGTYGSFCYARDAYRRGDNIYAVLNIDIIGWAETEYGGNILRFSYADRSKWIAEFANDISEKYNDILDMWIEEIPNYRGADHQAFIDYGYDGVWIVEHDGGKYCNTPFDNLTYINATYMARATKLLLAILVEMAIKPIDVQVIIKTPYEGTGYWFNTPIIPLNMGKHYFEGYRGMTLIIGRAVTRCEVISKEEVKTVAFCINDYFVSWDSKPPYEWKIEGKYLPLIGKHKLRVVAYTTSGKQSIDEMDINIITLAFQHRIW
jgi:hypothetical protein